MISNITHFSKLGKSDHDILLFDLYIPKEKPTLSKQSLNFNYKKGDYKKMREELKDIDWSYIIDLNVEEQWTEFKYKLFNTIENNVPKISNKVKNKIKPKWFTNRVIKKIKKKHNAYQKYDKSKLWKDYLDYIEARDTSERERKNAEQVFELNLARQMTAEKLERERIQE